MGAMQGCFCAPSITHTVAAAAACIRPSNCSVTLETWDKKLEGGGGKSYSSLLQANSIIKAHVFSSKKIQAAKKLIAFKKNKDAILT